MKYRSLPNSSVIDAINDKWKNIAFTNDFAKILTDDVDFNDLAELISIVKKSDKDLLWIDEDIYKYLIQIILTKFSSYKYYSKIFIEGFV